MIHDGGSILICSETLLMRLPSMLSQLEQGMLKLLDIYVNLGIETDTTS